MILDRQYEYKRNKNYQTSFNKIKHFYFSNWASYIKKIFAAFRDINKQQCGTG